MIGISSKLARSIIILTILHLVLGAFFYYSLSPTQYLNWLKFTGQEAKEINNLVVLNSILIADFKEALLKWWPFFLISSIISFFLLVSYIVVIRVTRKKQQTFHDSYKDISVSIGKLYKPKNAKLSKKKFQFPPEISKNFSALLTEILNYQLKNKLAFKETMEKLDKALELEPTNDKFIVAVAATGLHPLPIKAYRALGQLKSWWQLTEEDRQIIAFSAAYHKETKKIPAKIPYLSDEARAEIDELTKLLNYLPNFAGKQLPALEFKPSNPKTEGLESKQNGFIEFPDDNLELVKNDKKEAVSLIENEEKNAVKVEINRENKVENKLEEILEEAFINAIKNNHFQNYGYQKDIKSIGWRKGNKLYLLQNVLNDNFEKTIKDKKWVAEIENAYLGNEHLYTFAKAAVSMPNIKSWLVTERKTLRGKRKATADYPMWVVKVGEKDFVGVLIFELPKQLQYLYPQETKYQLEVLDAYKIKIKNDLIQPEFFDFF